MMSNIYATETVKKKITYSILQFWVYLVFEILFKFNMDFTLFFHYFNYWPTVGHRTGQLEEFFNNDELKLNSS